MLAQVEGEFMFLRLMFASVLVGCEQVAPEGDPLQPVVVERPAPEEAQAASADVDPEPTDAEPFSISSEELLAIATGEAGEAKEEPATAEGEAPEEAPPPAAVPAEPPPSTR